MAANRTKPIVDGGFVVARGHSSESLSLAEEVLDEMALFVDVGVDLPFHEPIRLRRNERPHSFAFDRLDDCVGVVAFVPDEVLAAGFLDELGGLGDVVDVSGREVEVEWIAEPVHESVDLGCKTSARASNTRILGPPFPPAESWCALA